MAVERIVHKSAPPIHLVVLVLLPLCLSTARLTLGEESVDENPRSCVTRSGVYRVSYTSALEPIVINHIHDWTIHVETADGAPVTGAEIGIGGGMPAHNHGLPTSPRQTAELGGGDYLIEGMRFHMNGQWEIAITVSANARRDSCILSLKL